MNQIRTRLVGALDRHDSLTVAVSGGVDSMTLAFAAHRFARRPVAMVHASSPAVPALATARVRAYAEREGWTLTVIDAGEFNQPSYLANPVDRCYFCKSCLYGSIEAMVEGAIASGANLDDLDDYRPGLTAAAEHRIVHPFIEAGIDKAGIRSLAHDFGLDDIAELPAQPCLASRVETGIGIDALDLAFVEEVEGELQRHVGDGASGTALRCRVTQAGIAVELAGLSEAEAAHADALAREACARTGRVYLGARPYKRGSAFVGAARTAFPSPTI